MLSHKLLSKERGHAPNRPNHRRRAHRPPGGGQVLLQLSPQLQDHQRDPQRSQPLHPGGHPYQHLHAGEQLPAEGLRGQDDPHQPWKGLLHRARQAGRVRAGGLRHQPEEKGRVVTLPLTPLWRGPPLSQDQHPPPRVARARAPATRTTARTTISRVSCESSVGSPSPTPLSWAVPGTKVSRHAIREYSDLPESLEEWAPYQTSPEVGTSWCRYCVVRGSARVSRRTHTPAASAEVLKFTSRAMQFALLALFIQLSLIS